MCFDDPVSIIAPTLEIDLGVYVRLTRNSTVTSLREDDIFPSVSIQRQPPTSGEEDNNNNNGKDGSIAKEGADPVVVTKIKASIDPLHWFGILVPQALRSAQGNFSTAVQEVLPRLVETQLQMSGIEQEVRLIRERQQTSR